MEEREMMQHIADGFTAAAVLAGLWAALLWWRSGKVKIDPQWSEPDGPPLNDPSLDQIAGQLRELNRPERWKARNDVTQTSAKFNSDAAVWTAVSVALQAAATVFDRFAMP